MQIRNSELLVTLEIAYLISFPWQWRQDVAETSDLSIVSFCLYMTTKLYLKFSLQVGHSTNSNIRSQVPFTLAKHLILLSCKSNKIIKFGLARCTLWIVTAQLHGYHSNMASGSVTIPTWRRAWTLSFRPTNYEQCLQLSEWVTHLHIGVPTTNTFLHLAYPRV